MGKRWMCLLVAAAMLFAQAPSVYATGAEEIIIEDSNPGEVVESSIVVEDILEEEEVPYEKSVVDSGEETPSSDNYGLIPNEFEADPLEASEVPRRRVVLPLAYDSREYGTVTDVKDQDIYGTCWAFGALASGESTVLSKEDVLGTYLDFAERHLAYFFYHTVTDPLGNTHGDSTTNLTKDYLQQGGNGLFTTFALANWVGAASENLALYQELIDNANEYKEDSESFFQHTDLNVSTAYMDDYHMQNAYWISMGPKNRTFVKQAIMDYGALAVSYYSDDSCYNLQTNSYYSTSTKSPNHMVALVGWNDDYDKNNFSTSPSENGAWLMKNSWGSDWGEEGYFWISYEDWTVSGHEDEDSQKTVKATTAFVYEFEDGDNYSNNYQYDGSYGTRANSINNGGSIANIFQVKANPTGAEVLEAVSFAPQNTSVNYSIQVYRNLTDLSDPTSGTPFFDSPVTGRTIFQGYYTIPLGTSVPLTEDSYYSIVITLTKTGASTLSYTVDDSYQNMDWISFQSTVQEGQSFEQDEAGAKWDDLSSEICDQGDKSSCVARVKGFTNNIDGKLIKEITLDKTVIKLHTGETDFIKSLMAPEDAQNQNLEFSSSDVSVATVDNNGTVKAVGAGQAEITVVAADGGGALASCEVSVSTPLPTVTPTPTSTPIPTPTPTPYKITYKLNGGKNNKGNPSSYYKEKITLKNPSREKYVFKGWYTNKKCTKRIKTISASQTGKLTLYAKWQKVSVAQVTLDKARKTGSRKIRSYYEKVSGAYAYQITYSTSKKFTAKTTKSVRTKKLAYTVTKLKKNKTYYIKVRAYKRDSAGNNIYGKYSKVKTVK